LIKLRITLLGFLCLLFLQIRSLYAQNLVFKNINVDNGLSQNTVLSVLQDKKGYLWVGTYDGLSRYNGLEFKVFKNEAKNGKSLSNNHINKLFVDNKGNLWIGTTNGLNLYIPDKESFIRYKTNHTTTNYTVLDVVEDKQGIMWVGTDHGLFYLEQSELNTRSLTLSKICGNDKITGLYVDNEQHIWIGGGQTLKIYDSRNKRFLELPNSIKKDGKLLNSVVRSIIQDQDKNYWIATETNGLFCYNPKTSQCYNYTQSNGLLSNTVRAVLERDKHMIWVGTKKGLNIINTQTGKICSFTYDVFNLNSLSQNSIRCIFKDNEDNIWIGTYNGGLNSVYSQFDNFYSLGRKRGGNVGLSYNIVNAIFAGDNGDYWVGTDDGGLNHVDSTLQNNKVYYQFNGASRELLGNSIKAIANHADRNKLWIATASGLNFFDKTTGIFTATNYIAKPAIPGYIQNYVLLKNNNGLWIGTNFSGLYFLDNTNKLHAYKTVEQNVISLLQDGNILWIGLKNTGLNKLDLQTQRLVAYQPNVHQPYSLGNNTVTCIYKDSKARLWLGTDGGGINYLNTQTNRFYSIDEDLGIANNTIHGILEDRQGRLWVSTNKGISSIAINKFKPPFNAGDITTQNYTVADGLQSNQFMPCAAITASNRNMAFAGINGITVFDPDKVKINRIKPQVVFTDFSIFNKSVSFADKSSPLLKPIDETSEITLKYSQAFFSIKFAALNFINPEKNQFAFKLEGFSDNDWHYVGNQRIATYTNLDPGTYYFKIKAANNNGIWNNSPRELKIIVLPPWYKTWYAFVGYLIIAVFLLYLFNIYSKKTERLKNELKYESMSHSKDQELAKKQLNFFVNISHEIKTPLTMIMAPLQRLIEMNIGNNKVQNQLMLMQRNGDRLIRLINQLLDKKKLETGHMQLQATEAEVVSFIKEIQLAFDGLAKLKNIELKLSAKQPDIKLWFDKDKFEKLIYNLLSNAIKFTPDYGKITISVHTENEQVLISVEDNGCGIAQANIDKIFSQFYHYDSAVKIDGTGLGLAFSKELIDLHHGQLTVESRAEAPGESGYTRFTISLPLGKDHLKENEIAGDFKDSEDILSYNRNDKTSKAQLQIKKQAVLKKEGRERFLMLIVEDNEDVLNFIKEGFDDDFEVLTATNGFDGFSLATEVSPDIIISDVMMPGMDGIELCSKLKSDINTSHIPVILLTARTQMIFKIEGIETGADDYITKPFNFNMVEARVWNLIESRQKLRERYQKEIKLEPHNITISNLDEVFLNKVLNYIELHITDEELSVEQLSQEVAMSKSSFYKKIKSLTNQTGVEFIRTVRIKRAAQLLAQGQLSINEVSYMVGFMDVDYFRKCFKEHFKYTPKEHPVTKES
jgi:signal transduction histidine kinase/ligand-binding sensor domain-containing protein/DNA-binding response OmpR family regulator